MKLLFFGFVMAYNPWYINYLMDNGALGGMSIRVWSGGLVLSVFAGYILLRLLSRAKFNKSTPIFGGMLLFSAVAFTFIVKGLISNEDRVMVIADAFPLVEFILVFFAVRLMPSRHSVDIGESQMRWLLLYLGVMGLTDIASYTYLTFVKGVSFGALRADVGGVIVNRLMDFVVPIFAPIAYFYRGKAVSGKIRVVINSILLTVVLLTFFRTVYVAVISTFLYISVRHSRRALRLVLMGTVVFVTVFAGIYFLEDRFDVKYQGQGVASLALARVSTIFLDIDTDLAITSRFDHNKQMMHEIPSVILLGKGAGALFDDDVPVQFASNYFLQLIFILGVPGALLFFGIYWRVFWTSARLCKIGNDQSSVDYMSISGIVLCLAVILSFFPYTVYFPLMYILGVVFAMFDKSFTPMKRQVSLG